MTTAHLTTPRAGSSPRAGAWRRFRIGAVAAAAVAVVASTLSAPAAYAAPTVVAKDTFERTVAGGWGTATTGGAYSGGHPADALSVARGSVASRSAPASPPRCCSAVRRRGSVRSDVAVRLDKLSGAAYYATLLRYQADGSHYRARLQLNSSGIPFLAVSRVNGKSETALATVKLGSAMTAGTWYTLSFTVTGTSPVAIKASLTKRGARRRRTPAEHHRLLRVAHHGGRPRRAGGATPPAARRATP